MEMSYCIDKNNMHRYGFTGLKRTRLSQGGGGVEGAEQGLPYRAFAGANPDLWSTVKAGLEKRCIVCHRTMSAGWHGQKVDWAVGVGQ